MLIEEGGAISENMMRLEKSWRCGLFIGEAESLPKLGCVRGKSQPMMNATHMFWFI